ncbi:MAG: hypothetical protein U0795_00290 [Pirellulales bacterium]
MNRALAAASVFTFAVLFSQIAGAADPPISETYPIDVTIAQNQPLEIVRPNVFDPKHEKLLTLSGVLAGPAPGSLAISFDWLDEAGVKHNSPVQEFPFLPGGVNQVSMEYIVPFCPAEVSVDFRLANADVVRFVGEFKHECLIPEPSSLVLGAICAVLAIGTRRKR